MRTYNAPGTVSSNLHNLTPIIFARWKSKLYNLPFTHKATCPSKLNHLFKVTKLGCGKVVIINVSNSKGYPFTL